MKLTFLGTGTSQGVPMIACPCEVCASVDPRDKRLRTSALIQIESEAGFDGKTLNIVIDAGPDFRAQMLSAGVRHLDAILLTHEHRDHTGGLDDIRGYNYFDRASVDVWATERVQGALKQIYAYAFGPDAYPGAPEVVLHTFSDEPFEVKRVRVVPIEGRHAKLPVNGFRIGQMAYLTDFNGIEDAAVEKLRGVKTLVVNALGHAPHPTHFNLEQAIDLSRKVGAERTFLTHIAHRMGLYATEQPKLPEGVFFAYDNLTLEI